MYILHTRILFLLPSHYMATPICRILILIDRMTYILRLIGSLCSFWFCIWNIYGSFVTTILLIHILSFLLHNFYWSILTGRSRSIVDANLRVLKERIEEVRIKERLERCCSTSEKYGWNYAPHCYNYKHKREASLSNYIQLLGWVGGTSGLVILSGTAILSLVSLIVHFNHWVACMELNSLNYIYIYIYTYRSFLVIVRPSK